MLNIFAEKKNFNISDIANTSNDRHWEACRKLIRSSP